MDLLRELAVYRPWNEQEERDCAELLRRLHSGEELYSRDNAAAHLTVSAWVVSPDRSQVLMAYHKLYDSWAWLGGHADGDRDLLVWFAGAALVLLAAEWLLHAKENSV